MSDDDQEIPEPAPGIDPAAHAAILLENALLKAGVDLDTEQGKIIAKANRGETPDVEAIKAQWEAVKPKPEVAPEPEPEPRIEGETDQVAIRASLSASSTVEPNPADVDPKVAALNAGFAVLNPAEGTIAGTREDAQAAAVHVLFEAAERGDPRVMASGTPA